MTRESLSLFLESVGNFHEEEQSLLLKEIKEIHLAKGEIILNAGEVCSLVHFVVSGSLYQYKLNTDLDKEIIDLYTTDDWALNHRSFISRKPSQYSIEAFEESLVFEISIQSIHKLIANSQSFLRLGSILEKTSSRLSFFDNNSSADEKYRFVLNHRPDLLQRFPLGMIASYLKIKPETLSRIRKKIR